MDKEKFFSNTPEIFYYLRNHGETDFLLHMTGYHNFRYITPEKFERTQYFHTLHFVISGKGYININGKIHNVYANDVFYLDDQTLFSYYPDKNTPWEYVFFEFKGRLANVYAKDAGFSAECPKKNCPTPQKVLTYLAKIFKDQTVVPSYHIIASLFFLILDTLLPTQTQKQGFGKNDFIDEVKYFIQFKCFNPNFNITYLCKSMHVSHSYLCKIFKQYEKTTLITFINKIKMHKARVLLKSSDLSIMEISLKSGYREYEYFLRLFKQMHGVSPTNYRKRYTDHANAEK